ncbi:MAG: hypothetical protein IM336_03635 [Microcystis sp. M018S1]|uniref:DNA primase family protein n=1 Tax=unclassified Microcystis TaxID=2643300 RepID=UPI002590D31A|nr:MULTISPECIES: DNA primase family protein [unclassified Microcystis]MCA2917363.1 hypothetical protein [Microcystis sp. M017S1]MCA2929623.1 hypothetical protein [Microcystis sp. M018S1]
MPKKRKSVEQEDTVSIKESGDDAVLTTQVSLKKSVVETLMRTEFFIKDVHWETKLSYFKLFDACKYFPSDKDVNLEIAYTRAKDIEGFIGRLKSSLDINALWRPLKQTILSDYYDIDIKSCHASLILYVAKKNNYDVYMPHIEQLVDRKQQAIDSICYQYDVDANQAKQFLTSLLYGAGYESFFDENNIPISKRDKNVQVDNIKKDISNFLSCFKQTVMYSRYLQYARNKSQEKINSKKQKKTEAQIEFKAMAYFLQTIECNILYEVINYLKYQKYKSSYTSPVFIVPAHDGLYIFKKNVDDLFGSLDNFVEEINTFVSKKYLGHIVFVEKPMTEKKDLEKEPQTMIDFYSDMNEIHMSRLTASLAADITSRSRILRYHSTVYMWNGVVWTPDKSEQEILINVEINRQIATAGNLSHYFYTGAPDTKEIYNEETKTTQIGPTIWFKIKKCWIDALDRFLSGQYNKSLSDSIMLRIPLVTELIFDTHPYIFCFKNLYYDLKSGQYFDPDPDLYMTTHCGYDYVVPQDVEEKIKQVDNFFHEIIDIDIERQNLIWWLGTGFIAKHYERFYVAQGSGGNGKSLLTGYMRHSLGNYFYDAPISIVYGSNNDTSSGPNADLFGTSGKRYGVVCEPKRSQPLDADKIKKLTGQNVITTRDLYKSNTTIRLQISLTLECNTLPSIEVDGAIQRRFIGTQFLQKFTQEVSKWQDIYRRMNLPVSRVKKANPEFASEAHLISMRIPFFLYIQNHLQSFFKNGEQFHQSVNAMCSAFTEEEVIVDPGDDYQNMMSWFNAKYEYIPPITNSDPIEIMHQIVNKCILKSMTFPWESGSVIPNPLNVYSTPVSYIFKEYLKDYHGQDKVKNVNDFKRIFAQQTQMSGCILPANNISRYGDTVWKKSLWDQFKEKYPKLFEEKETEKGKEKEWFSRIKSKGYLRDTNSDRVLHYLPISIEQVKVDRQNRIAQQQSTDTQSQGSESGNDKQQIQEDEKLEHFIQEQQEQERLDQEHFEEDFTQDFYTQQ